MKDADRSSVIYQALWKAILEKALKPGAKLPEDAIGEQFGVSRTIVRLALTRLANEGLVDTRRNRGAAVATPDWDEARDIWKVRVGLERLVVTMLAEGLSNEQCKTLKAHVDAEDKARLANDLVAVRLASEFHILLAEMTGSKILTRYVSEISARCGLILPRHNHPNSPNCSVNEHREIIAALTEDNTNRAGKLMDAHLNAVASRALSVASPGEEKGLRDILSGYAPTGGKVRARK